MKNDGFTLIELLGVIIILSLLIFLAFPSIINSVKNSSNKTDNLTKEMIYKASNLYVSNHINKFQKINGNKYIIELKDLVEEEYLVSPIKLSNNKDVTNKKCVQVVYNNGFKYELKDNGTCEKTRICILDDKARDKRVDLGDEVTCGSESFYVIPNDFSAHPTATVGNMTLLAKYNLDVGSVYDGTSLTPISNPTGIQNREAIGWRENEQYPYYGVIAFSSENYWGSAQVGQFIYDHRSLLYKHVENYKIYMENLGVDVKEASLVSFQQFNTFITSRNKPQDFVHTSFWLGTAYGEEHDDFVSEYMSNGNYGRNYYYHQRYGVRPIIVIPKSDVRID